MLPTALHKNGVKVFWESDKISNHGAFMLKKHKLKYRENDRPATIAMNMYRDLQKHMLQKLTVIQTYAHS